MGLMLTTIGQAKGPEGMHGIFVIYMDTFFPSSMFLTGRPDASMALSKEKLHPSRKLTIPW
jgi:hypothetical protein